MKIITVPDLHGKDDWKQIQIDSYDKIVFLGDYCDAPYLPNNITNKLSNRIDLLIDEYNGKLDVDILKNLIDIIELKDLYPDKVVLLLGNHELPYYFFESMFYADVMCTGHRKSMLFQLYDLFRINKDKFDVAFQMKNVLWTHAGLTPSFYDAYENKDILEKYDNRYIDFTLNSLFRAGNFRQLLNISTVRRGRDMFGGIFWADISEFLYMEYNLNFKQIVGHTPINDTMFLKDNKLRPIDELNGDEYDVIFVDVLNNTNNKNKFFEIEIAV